MTVIWAVHTLSGIVTLANAVYSVSELTHQLKSSKARVLFTCVPLLGVALAAAKQAGIPEKHVYILSVPHESSKSVGNSVSKRFKTLNQLIANGVELPVIERVPWATGRGARQVALLSYSSGTSGPPVRAKTYSFLFPCYLPSLISLKLSLVCLHTPLTSAIFTESGHDISLQCYL